MLKTTTKTAILFLLLFQFQCLSQTNYTISGSIREKGSKEQLIGVNVYIPGTTIGTSSNTYGFYSLTVSKRDTLKLIYSYVGYEPIQKNYILNKNIEQDIELESVTTLAEVSVSARKINERVSDQIQMSTIEIPINQIKKIPTLLGEKDVLKVLQLMPGVQKGSEGQSGIYVRGGGPDQNLIILDDAVVYNANHLFGFFSTFNGDALKSVELTKGGFPARYGGRLSSVIELNMKDGNKEKLSGEGGIGLIASRLVLEGPIKNKKGGPTKASFLVSARRTYLDVIAKPFIAFAQKNEKDKTKVGYYFYDFNAKFNYEFSKKDKLYLSGYFGRDKFYVKQKGSNYDSKGGIDWGNTTGTLRWNHLYSQKLFSNTSLIASKYSFNIYENVAETGPNGSNEFILKYNSDVSDIGIKHDLDFYPNSHHSIKFGLQTTMHKFTPSALVLKNSNQNIFENKEEIINTIESGIYVEDSWVPANNIKFNLGLRLSHYQTKMNSYFRPEPRFAIAWKINKDLALKASYARMNQYIHLLSNTGLGLPTDLWVPATDKIAPQQSDQWAIGAAKDLDKGFTLTIEAYYKKMGNLINYKEGASFLSIDSPEGAEKEDWQTKITSGKGISYGFEILLQKKVGRFSGWLGYTWSKTLWTFPELNFGKTFYPKYDRRNDLSLVGIYELSKKITLSSTWVYGTGNALTIPLAEYSATDGLADFNYNPKTNEYGQRNSFRAEPYHRLDIGIQFHKKIKTHERTWDFSLYNAYNRKNPFFYQVESSQTNGITGGITRPNSNDKLVLKRYSLFPVIPAFSYNFKF